MTINVPTVGAGQSLMGLPGFSDDFFSAIENQATAEQDLWVDFCYCIQQR